MLLVLLSYSLPHNLSLSRARAERFPIRDVQPEILEQDAANLLLARLTDAAEFIVFSRSEVDRVFERPQLGSEGLTLVGPCVNRLFDNKNECTSCSCKFVQL